MMLWFREINAILRGMLLQYRFSRNCISMVWVWSFMVFHGRSFFHAVVIHSDSSCIAVATAIT
jgi:hypothetical protein